MSVAKILLRHSGERPLKILLDFDCSKRKCVAEHAAAALVFIAMLAGESEGRASSAGAVFLALLLGWSAPVASGTRGCAVPTVRSRVALHISIRIHNANSDARLLAN